MNPPPVLTDAAQDRANLQHLDLLAIFHFVLSGLGALGLGFLFLHYSFFNSLLAHPDFIRANHHLEINPAAFFHAFSWFYGVFGFFAALGMLLNLLSGFCLLRRTHRIFSLIVAGLNCLHLPFGTALGVFTIIVLNRHSVQRLYSQLPGKSPVSGNSPGFRL